ncbi:MAG: DUF2079 domain-containing protein [Chloroflexi bacterium]|nr:DUF2079 domain-containing protein [Chloroflexota bacterium]
MPPVESYLANIRQRKCSILRGIDLCAYGLTAVFFAVFSIVAVRKLESLSVFGVDFAFFDQAIWNSLHGRVLQQTIYLDSPTILGHHFSPLLLAIVPLYGLLSDPRMLALVPPFAISLASFPIYWLARKELGRPLALVIVVAYLLSPVAQYAAMGQFYDLDLAVPLLSFGMLFLLRRRFAPFLVCLGLALLVKEEVAFAAIGLGIYVALVQRKPRFGVALSSFCLAATLFLLVVVIPHFQSSSNYYFFGSSPGRSGQNLYGYLGSDLTSIVGGFFTHPVAVWQHVATPAVVDAIGRLLLPLGLLPLLGWQVTFVALPILGYILLSDASWVYTFGSWHYTLVIPFLFGGLVAGIKRILSWRPAGAGNIGPWNAMRTIACDPVAVGTFTLAVALAFFLSGLSVPPASDLALLTDRGLTPHTQVALSMAQVVPRDAVLVAQTELAPYVSERKRLYLDMAAPCLGIADYVFVDKKRPWYAYLKQGWDGILSSDLFQPLRDEDGLVLEKRIAPAQMLNANFGDRLSLVGYSLDLTHTVMGGQTLKPVLQWQKTDDSEEREAVSVGLYDDRGHAWALSEAEPGQGACPTDALDRGEVFADQYSLALPPTMPAGTYELKVGVVDKSSRIHLAVVAPAGQTTGEVLQVAEIAVEKDKRSYTATELQDRFQLDNPFFVDMGDMRLIGYKTVTNTAKVGETLDVGIYWRAREKPQGDYAVAIQLRDSAGNVAFEQASRPAEGTYSTTEWAQGEVLLDWHAVDLPADLTPGAYELFVALLDLNSGQALGEAAISPLTVDR